jgi:hypothetical protein
VQEPGTSIATQVADRSNGRTAFFRTSIRRTLYPGDAFSYGFPYRVDEAIYHRIMEDGQRLFDEPVKARAFVDGAFVTEVSRAVRDMQNF